EGDDAAIVIGSLRLDVANLVGEAEALALHPLLSRSLLASAATHRLFSLASIVREHGRVHPVVRKSAGLCLPLLRPHRHPRLSERSVSTGTSGLFLPRRSGPAGGEQRSAPPTHPRLPGLGGGLRPQPSPSHGVGRKGSAQRRLRLTPPAPSGQEQRVRVLFHLQEYGTGPDF